MKKYVIFVSAVFIGLGSWLGLSEYREWEVERASKSRETIIAYYGSQNVRNRKDYRYKIEIEERYLSWNYNRSEYDNIISMNYKTSQPVEIDYDGLLSSENDEYKLGDNIIIDFQLSDPNFIDDRIVQKRGGTYALYSEEVFPDSDQVKYGLSYRPQITHLRPEKFWKRIFVKKDVKKHDFLIRCIPPIAPGRIWEPDVCEMEMIFSPEGYGPHNDVFLVDLSFDAERLSDWRAIENTVISFLRGKLEFVENRTGNKA
ncbi:hypothetical protein [Parasphingorhabdus sp.]|uniref:hypothetical protein n=1 Tax=Parasphingorhabdus sp. TaxID=2709688 RepID=UPI002B26B108|nr:hypothetical protein [Parasphingorhabdus sp.]